MNGPQLLHEAGVLVASGWCQGAEAVAPAGEAVDPLAREASRWSLLGALQAAAFGDDSTSIGDIGDAVAAIAELIEDPSLAGWNDAPGRTSHDVERLLGDAEELAALGLTVNNLS
jgi:hypothetical protein